MGIRKKDIEFNASKSRNNFVKFRKKEKIL